MTTMMRSARTFPLALALFASTLHAQGAPPSTTTPPPTTTPAPASPDGAKAKPGAPKIDVEKPGTGAGKPMAPPQALPPSLYSTRAGFSARDLTDDERAKLGRIGFKVGTVTAGSGAEKGGLLPEDVVTSVDGGSFATAKELIARVQSADEGVLLKLNVVRGGKDVLVEVRLPGETPEEREQREAEEREKAEQEEKERAEAAEKAEEEAKAKAEEEAKAKAEEEAKKAGEEVVEQAEEEDYFGWLGCCICSALCPPAAPVLAVVMWLVDNEPPPRREEHAPREGDARVTVVRY